MEKYVLASSSGSLNNFGSAAIIAVSTKTGEVRRLVEGGYAAHYVAGPRGSSGHVVYMRDDSLFAVGFDPTKLEVQGDAVPVADDVSGELEAGNGHWDVSRNGVLLYRRRGRPAIQTWPVLWMDHTGRTRPLIAEHQAYRNMRFSPDGNRLALSVGADGGADMFVYDLPRDTMARLTSAGKGKQIVDDPVWTPDGKHIISRYPRPSGFGLAWYRVRRRRRTASSAGQQRTGIPNVGFWRRKAHLIQSPRSGHFLRCLGSASGHCGSRTSEGGKTGRVPAIICP